MAGRVKTRLCPPCTPAEAAALAEAALRDTLAVVASTPATARVLALDGAPGPWIPDGFVIVPQLGHGLDERLANAFAAVTGPALLIGMDTPQVSPALLTSAIDALHDAHIDAVLGPAHDGGWWAIGLRHADPRVFVGVPMSTPHTGAQQRTRLADLGLRTRHCQRCATSTRSPTRRPSHARHLGRGSQTRSASLESEDRMEDAV